MNLTLASSDMKRQSTVTVAPTTDGSAVGTTDSCASPPAATNTSAALCTPASPAVAATVANLTSGAERSIASTCSIGVPAIVVLAKGTVGVDTNAIDGVVAPGAVNRGLDIAC